ncbi:MAG: hypothetical protein IJI68_04685 [Eggerthellaceae bacterium]|nr:hypothetical protein [Eggerthellaceae bacterium]
MIQQDYLMRQLLLFFKAMVRTHELYWKDKDPLGAADSLEDAISNATEMDGVALLSLSPDSIASIMRVTGIDPNITQFVARSMLLESVYLRKAGKNSLAQVREAQARAIADEYGFGLPDDPSDFESITEGLEEAALAGGFDAVDAYDPLEGFEAYFAE